MRDFETAYAAWQESQFPTGGHWEPTAELKVDLAVAEESLSVIVDPVVEDGVPPSNSIDLEGFLSKLEGLRESAARLREIAPGEYRAIVEGLLEYNELLLEVYRGFLEHRAGGTPGFV